MVHPAGSPSPTGPPFWLAGRSVLAGTIGFAAIVVFYLLVVGVASGSVEHLRDQIRTDWWLLAPITAGFGLQIAMLSELRVRRRSGGAAAGAARAGAGTSAAGMLACCAHHVAEFVPFLGLTGVAAALTAWRTEMMVVGLAVNTFAVALIWRRLRTMSPHRREVATCAHA